MVRVFSYKPSRRAPEECTLGMSPTEKKMITAIPSFIRRQAGRRCAKITTAETNSSDYVNADIPGATA